MQDLKELNEVITAIKEEIRQGADALTTSKSVYEFKKTFLDNKQGRIGLLMKEMRNVANDQKAEFGKTINGAKEWANNFFDELDQKLKEKEQQQRYESEKIDITMPPVKIRYGNLHPVTTVRNQLRYRYDRPFARFVRRDFFMSCRKRPRETPECAREHPLCTNSCPQVKAISR